MIWDDVLGGWRDKDETPNRATSSRDASAEGSQAERNCYGPRGGSLRVTLAEIQEGASRLLRQSYPATRH